MRAWWSSLVAAIRCIFRPTVSRERAVELARAEFERRGWPFPGPGVERVTVEWGLVCHRVMLYGDRLHFLFVKVDKRDGRIRGVHVPPR